MFSLFGLQPSCTSATAGDQLVNKQTGNAAGTTQDTTLVEAMVRSDSEPQPEGDEYFLRAETGRTTVTASDPRAQTFRRALDIPNVDIGAQSYLASLFSAHSLTLVRTT